jgi:hypothetical protein
MVGLTGKIIWILKYLDKERSYCKFGISTIAGVVLIYWWFVFRHSIIR